MDDSGWLPSRSYIVRRCLTPTSYKIMLSNHQRLWGVEGTAEQLMKLAQEENPLCEFHSSKVIKNIFNLFDKSLDTLVVDGIDQIRTLTMSSSLGNMPFRLVWTLCDKGPSVLYEEVTCPLLKFTKEMTKRQEYLCCLLIDKDKEIDEHVSENGKLMWGRVITEKFDVNDFRNDPSFVSCNQQDLVETVWEDQQVVQMFNKSVLNVENTKDEDDVGKPDEKNENISVKQEETLVETAVETVPDKLPKAEITPVESNSKTKNKRKKVKLNI